MVASGLRNRSFKNFDFFDQFALGLGAHRRCCQSSFTVLNLFFDSGLSEAVRVHALEKVFLLAFQVLDLSDKVAHTVLILALVGSDALGVVDSRGQLALPRVASSICDSTLANLPSLLDQLFFLGSLRLDEVILGCHVAIEIRLGRLLEHVFLLGKLRNLSLRRKHYFFPLWTVHMVILVDPAILILLVITSITSVTSITSIVVVTASIASAASIV